MKNILLKEKIKDYIIMQMYYNNFDDIKIQQTETSMWFGISKIDEGWDFDEIVNR